MFQMFTCEQGHAWEYAPEEGHALTLCPSCGKPPDLGGFLEGEPSTSTSHSSEFPPAELPLLDDSNLPVVMGYDQLQDLGRGPGGVRLYRARQKVVGRTVLLQVVLAREDSSQRAWNYLRGEASAHGKLSHPNILAVHEVGERDRHLFFNVFEFVEGPTLADLVGDSTVPCEEIAPLMELLARAVAHASQRNIQHRHLEPSAVLMEKVAGPVGGPARDNPRGSVCRFLGGYYVPKVRGFGLARRPTEGDTIDADLFVEAGYLSPEQVWGRVSDLGRHTDVYALGGILYFLLCGRMPFRGPSLGDIIDAIQTAPLVSPAQTRRVPADLLFICKKALARQPNRRYPEASEMADDLRRAAMHLPLPSRQLSSIQRFGNWCRRRPGVAALWVVALLGILGTLIGLVGGDPSGESYRDWRSLQQSIRTSHNDINNLRTKLGHANKAMAWYQTHHYLHEIARAAPLVAQKDQAARLALRSCAVADRAFEWHYLRRTLAGEGTIVLPATAGTSHIAYHGKDRNTLATAGWDAEEEKAIIRIWDVANKRVEGKVPLLMRKVTGLAYVPESNRLAFIYGGKSGFLRLLEDPNLQEPSSTLEHPIALAASSNGKRLIVMNRAGEIQMHDADDGEDNGPVRPNDQPEMVSHMVFRPDSLSFATFARGGKKVHEREIDNGRVMRTYEMKEAIESIAYDSRGHLAIAHGEKSLTIYRVHDQEPAHEFTDLPGSVKQMAFSRDGKRLALACDNATIRILALVPPMPDDMWNQVRGRENEWKDMLIENEETWHDILTIKQSGVLGLAFGPADRSLAAVGPDSVVVLGDVGN